MNIYIHIPFCHSKCAYCAFLSHCDIKKEDEYIAAVCREITEKLSNTSRQPEIISGLKDKMINTIYFGGGTPSLIKTESIAKTIETLREFREFSNNMEVTLECNPEDIPEPKLKSWHKAGINRLSIGVQSLDNDVRKLIGRKLDSELVLEKVALAQKYFESVGVDLIACLPGEDWRSLNDTVVTISELGITHISLYDLETDNDSEIGKNSSKYSLLDGDERANLLLESWKLLTSLGYEQYEISNFARDRKYCKHNLDFWQGQDYLGFGLGASSRIGNIVITNTLNFQSYIENPLENQECEELTQKELKQFSLASSIRLNQPFDIGNIGKEVLQSLVDEGLLTNHLTPQLTLDGKLVSDSILALLLDSHNML